MSLTTAAAITAGGTVASGLIGAGANIARSYKQYKYQKKAMELQNQLNLQNWNLQNEYNSPKAQMERYTDAGLNPNLIYSDGQASAGNSSSAPEAKVAQYEAPHFNAEFISQSIRDYMQGKMMQANLENKEVENRILQAQEMALGVQLQESLLNLEKNQLDFDDYFLSRKSPNRKNPYTLANEQSIADIRYTNQQTLRDMATGMKTVYDTHKLQAEIRKLDYEYNNILPQLKDLNDWEIELKLKEYEKLDLANEISWEELSFLRDTYAPRLNMSNRESQLLNTELDKLTSEAKRSKNGIVHDWVSKLSSALAGAGAGAAVVISYLKYKSQLPVPRTVVRGFKPNVGLLVFPNAGLMTLNNYKNFKTSRWN